MVPGARNVFSEFMGQAALRSIAGDVGSGRIAVREQRLDREAWQRLLRLYRPDIFPAIAAGRSGRLSAVCKPDFAREMNTPEPSGDNEPPGVPGFSTWRAVYIFVFIFFV